MNEVNFNGWTSYIRLEVGNCSNAKRDLLVIVFVYYIYCEIFYDYYSQELSTLMM